MTNAWPTHCIPTLVDLLVTHFESQRNVYYGSQKSPTLLIEEHCNTSGYQITRCPARCFRGYDADGKTCEICKGRNFVARRAKDVHSSTVVCPSCNGSGQYWRKVWVFHILDEFGERRLWGSRPNEEYGVTRPEDLPCCTKCKGQKYIENYNVNPSMVAIEEAQVTDDMLARHNGNAKVSAALTQLQANDARAALCIELLYGDVGEQASTTPLGRDFALWPLTIAGSQLIDMGRQERAAKPKQQSCALPKTHRVILRQLNRELDLTKSLSDMAQVGASALRMDAFAKLFTADKQTGGHLLLQLTMGSVRHENELERIAS